MIIRRDAGTRTDFEDLRETLWTVNARCAELDSVTRYWRLLIEESAKKL
jgi:hypothetical protein